MRQILFYISFFILLFISNHSLSAKIWINEFMQSNINCIMDDLLEFPDSWVELYNDSEESVDIQNWYIADNADLNSGWKITEEIIIPAKGYQLIYCDKASTGIHTNFRLESGSNGEIHLFDTSGQTVDKVTKIPKQPAPNIARGRVTDAADQWEYFITATPGEANQGPTSKQLAPNPLFSQAGGVFKEEVSLKLSLPGNAKDITEQQIYYTTDGSEPTTSSNIYTEEIVITKPTVIRAKIIAPGYLIGTPITQTYIISDRDLSLPVVSLSLNPEYLWDDDLGIYVAGSGKNGIEGLCSEKKVNWNQDWRRPVNIEYFPDINNRCVLNQVGELRISGRCSRTNPQKSFVIYANKRFGEKRFDYPLFKEKPNQEIKSFLLRNSGNDFLHTHFRDAAIQLFMGGKVDVDYQAYQPAILFVNGEYFGIQNIRERTDEDYIYANYNGLEDIDLFENFTELKTGDWNDYRELTNRMELAPETISYEELKDKIDIPEFINFYILHMYAVNLDFPGNNTVCWKPKKKDGKWRFILKDIDISLGLYGTATADYDVMTFNTRVEFATLFLRTLLTKEEFVEDFLNCFAIYMGDILHKSSTRQIIDSVQQQLKTEMPFHRKNWGLKEIETWNEEVAQMKEWCELRNDYMYANLNEFFKLKGTVPVQVNIEENVTETSSVSINGIQLKNSFFDGQYYKGKQIHIFWNGAETSTFSSWRVNLATSQDTIHDIFYEKEISFLIPDDCSNLSFIATTDTLELRGAFVNITTNNGFLSISGLKKDSESTISVYSSMGRLLKESKTNNSFIDVPIQAKGILIIRITEDERTVTKKVFAKGNGVTF